MRRREATVNIQSWISGVTVSRKDTWLPSPSGKERVTQAGQTNKQDKTYNSETAGSARERGQRQDVNPSPGQREGQRGESHLTHALRRLRSAAKRKCWKMSRAQAV